jgi:putative transposase
VVNATRATDEEWAAEIDEVHTGHRSAYGRPRIVVTLLRRGRRVNHKRVGRVTYLPTRERWLYLATLIDLHSREVIGHAMADHMRAELVRDALDLTVTRSLIGDDAIFHADRRSQYTSGLFRCTLAGHGIRPSVGRTGSCFDNAVAELFSEVWRPDCRPRR